ncbi:MAG TPA: DUF3858 domain-containing protein, partial [Terriglobales bacterium]|nr:DUF3858 domain-containing protein [Terriglobales bacterium]
YEQYEQAATQLARVLKVSGGFAPAQELKFQLAAHFAWRTEQAASLQQRLRLHPGCSALADAIKFYDSTGQQQQADFHETRLAHCSLKPYQYWEELGRRGKHQRVITSVDRVLLRDPHDRHALTVGIREAVLANDQSAAERYAHRLHAIAPNWSWAELLISHPAAILDSRSAYAPANDFYKPYVRDPLPMMADRPAQLPANRVLINDRVIKLDSGGAWVYQHKVTQAFDKRGIALAGEVELPRSIDLLELRTVKSNGEFVEPELSESRGTVSMPSFSEGDAVDIAWLQHFSSESLAASPETLNFVFAAMEAPTSSAKLTLIREGVPEPLLWHSPELQIVNAEQNGQSTVFAWQLTNIPALLGEPGAPQYEKRPRMLWLSMDKTSPREPALRLREEMIEATRITPRIEDLAQRIHGSTAEAKITEAYRLVTSKIENEAQSWQEGNVTSAEESFQQNEGSRSAALIALLSALDFEADLELAAERGNHDPNNSCPDSRCYTHPLVRIKLPNSKGVHLDPQSEGIAAGVLSPEVEGEQALLVARANPISQVVLVPASTNQRSTATADLQLDELGNIGGTIGITFGSLRGSQIRTTVRRLSAKERKEYFEEIATRILPNANDVSATLMHEDDPEQPLELELQVKAMKFARWNGPELQSGQIVPALGLSRMYATLPKRRDALVVDAPLIESSEFVVHLPSGVEPVRLPEGVDLKSSFGEYRTEFKRDGDGLRIIRSFRIPMQEIAASEYPAFSRFAFQIDTAERELIQLHKASVAPAPGGEIGVAQTAPALH